MPTDIIPGSASESMTPVIRWPRGPSCALSTLTWIPGKLVPEFMSDDTTYLPCATAARQIMPPSCATVTFKLPS